MRFCDYSFLTVWPHFPQVLRSECWPRKTPGPQVGQVSALTNSSPSIVYFDHFEFALGLSDITHRLLLLIQPLVHPKRAPRQQVLERLESVSQRGDYG